MNDLEYLKVLDLAYKNVDNALVFGPESISIIADKQTLIRFSLWNSSFYIFSGNNTPTIHYMFIETANWFNVELNGYSYVVPKTKDEWFNFSILHNVYEVDFDKFVYILNKTREIVDNINWDEL